MAGDRHGKHNTTTISFRVNSYEKGKTFSVYQIAYGTLYGYRNRAVWCKADTTS